MFYRTLWAICLVLIIFESSCNNTDNKKNIITQDSIFEDLSLCRVGTIEYDIKTVKQIATSNTNKGNVIAEVHIKYPELKCANEKLKTNVENYINSIIQGLLKENMIDEDTTKAKSIKSASVAFIKSCKKNVEELRKHDPDDNQVWYCDIIGNIEMQSDNFITLRFNYDSYTGGAHSNYAEYWATFNINDGKKLVFTDVIIDSEKFTKLAEIRFKQINGLPATQKLTQSEGFMFENDKFYISENFGLTKNGIIIYYEPYQVAPFSFGASMLFFKFIEIADMLNPSLFNKSA
ncbi:MAG: DUF3298 and DUF4163 domain-containing protein [Bacteroidia bacterium]|nr:DUF3298 and DUF4163 domain-containing protein [Bacteroidia bacterium]